MRASKTRNKFRYPLLFILQIALLIWGVVSLTRKTDKTTTKSPKDTNEVISQQEVVDPGTEQAAALKWAKVEEDQICPEDQ